MPRDSFVSIMVVAKGGSVLREFDHDKITNTARIAIDHDTEYMLRVRNLKCERRRVDVTIDGTKVMCGLVVPSYGSVDLERFQDSDKRFKAVLASSDGTGDPTSPTNGLIRVDVWEEIQLYSPPILRTFTAQMGQGYWYPGDTIGCMYSAGAEPQQLNFCGNLQAAMPVEPMKTVEGSSSNQQFTNVYWNGDVSSVPVTFNFRLTSKTGTTAPALYCHACGAKRIDGAKYCVSCGARLLT